MLGLVVWQVQVHCKVLMGTQARALMLLLDNLQEPSIAGACAENSHLHHEGQHPVFINRITAVRHSSVQASSTTQYTT